MLPPSLFPYPCPPLPPPAEYGLYVLFIPPSPFEGNYVGVYPPPGPEEPIEPAPLLLTLPAPDPA